MSKRLSTKINTFVKVERTGDNVSGADPGICIRGALALPPSLSIPLPFLSRPLPSPPILSPSLHSLPLPSEVGPCCAARRSGGALKLTERVRAEPGRQTVFGEL